MDDTLVPKQKKCGDCLPASRTRQAGPLLVVPRRSYTPIRPSCIECVEKHLGAAYVLLTEAREGYACRLRAIGHLFEAEDEAQAWPELHAAIREARKAYQADGTMPDWAALAGLVAEVCRSASTGSPDGPGRPGGVLRETGRELLQALRASWLVGMWRDRQDIGDSSEFARKLRERAQKRNREGQ